MSSVLPQYTKLPDQEEGEGEQDRLLAGDPGGSGASPDPTAELTRPGPSFPPSAVVPSPGLAKYTLEGQQGVFAGSQALCPRGATKEETIFLLLSAFPQLATREPNTIQFQLHVPPPNGDGPTSQDLINVSAAAWEEAIVHGRPSEITVSVVLSREEKDWRSLREMASVFLPMIFPVLMIYFFYSLGSSKSKCPVCPSGPAQTSGL